MQVEKKDIEKRAKILTAEELLIEIMLNRG